MQKEVQIYYKFFFVIILFVTISSCSSAYYNTFYNAEKLFFEGEIEYFSRASRNTALNNSKVNTIEKLEKSIQKCAKVLAYYGDDESNEYADDAYYLIAQSSYYLQNYTNVIEAVNALEDKHPNSEFIKDAKLLKAKSLVESGIIDQGKEVLNTIVPTNKTDSLNIQLIYAEMDFSENKTENGIRRLADVMKLIVPERNEQESSLLNQIYIKLNSKINETETYSNYLLLENILFKIRSNSIKKDLFENMFYHSLIVKNVKNLTYLRDNIDEGQFIEVGTPLRKHLEIGLKLGIYNEVNFDEYITETNAKRSNNEYLKYGNFYKSYYYDFVENNEDSVEIYLKKSANINNKIIKNYVVNRTRFLIKLEKINNMKFIYSDLDSINIIDPEYYFKMGEFYFSETLNDSALKSFSNYRDLSNDSSKIALSYLYSAYILENTDRFKADSIYNFIYQNFEEYKFNNDLLKKLGKEDNVDIDKRLDDLFDQADINTITYTEFIDLKNRIYQDDTLTVSDFNDKILYYEIYLLIKEENYNLAISKIKEFKLKYPKSIFYSELAKYNLKSIQIETEEEDLIEKEDSNTTKPKIIVKANNEELEFLVAPKIVYPGKKEQYYFEVIVDPNGDIINFSSEDQLDPLIRKKVNTIFAEIKYKKFEGEEPKKDLIIINFGSLNDFQDNSEGKKLLDE